MDKPLLSFIIPAFNEENNIGETIETIIFGSKNSNFQFEIIVIDNGSSDKTVEICSSYKNILKIFPSVTGTIAALRNFGVKKSKGDILIFIDADVSLPASWFSIFEDKMDYIIKNKLITGSKCISDGTDYLSQGWFSLIKGDKVKYINSGHMIMSFNTFNAIGGFDERLVTSEDVDICERARAIFFDVVNDNDLVALHRGYPKTAYQFIRREAWHGIQDVSSLKGFVLSKTALLSIFSTIIIISIIFFTLIFNSLLPIAIGVPLSITVAILFHFSKTKNITKSLLYWPITYLYVLGRSYSLFLIFKSRKPEDNRSPR